MDVIEEIAEAIEQAELKYGNELEEHTDPHPGRLYPYLARAAINQMISSLGEAGYTKAANTIRDFAQT